MLRKTDVLIGLLALLFLVTPTVLVLLRRPPPSQEDPCTMLTEKITPLLIKEIATTRVTLNAIKPFMYTEDKSFWQKYGKTISWTLVGNELAQLNVAVGVAAQLLTSTMKNSDKNCDAILYETTVSLDYGVPMEQLPKDWVTMRDNHLIVRLPPPKVLGLAKVELDNSKRIDQQTNRSSPDVATYSKLDQTALDYAQKNAQKWAEDLGVDKTCRENTRTVISSIISQFSKRPVTIEFEGEQGGTK